MLRNIPAVVTCCASLLTAGSSWLPAHAQPKPETSVLSEIRSLSPSSFPVSEYEALKAKDKRMAETILVAMRAAIFYAQESVGKPVLCATPIPISGSRLMAMTDEEINHPSAPNRHSYTKEESLAFVLMYALRKNGACQ
jgi:hypothetical protein